LSGRGLCDELITRPEESYRLYCVVVCDLETLWMRRPWTTGGLSRRNKQTLDQNVLSSNSRNNNNNMLYNHLNLCFHLIMSFTPINPYSANVENMVNF